MILNKFKFVLIFFLIYFVNISSFSNTPDYKKYYLEKLKEFEDKQLDIDLLFAEYCFFNNDPICYEENDTVSLLSNYAIGNPFPHPIQLHR